MAAGFMIGGAETPLRLHLRESTVASCQRSPLSLLAGGLNVFDKAGKRPGIESQPARPRLPVSPIGGSVAPGVVVASLPQSSPYRSATPGLLDAFVFFRGNVTLPLNRERYPTWRSRTSASNRERKRCRKQYPTFCVWHQRPQAIEFGTFCATLLFDSILEPETCSDLSASCF